MINHKSKMCVFNKYTQYTHTYVMKTKTFILNAINRD